jgi:hypothetical protein
MSKKWKCPGCGADAGKPGKGKCLSMDSCPWRCEGLICDCPCDTKKKHGGVESDPCHNARCYHCGWLGTLPVPRFDPATLKGWHKTAWTNGWTPPKGWTP